MCHRLMCALSITAALVAMRLPRQGGGMPRDSSALYKLCVANITKASPEAYASCKNYLEETSHDASEQVQYVETWLANYEKLRPYIQFLEGLPVDKNAPWFVYEPDLRIDLPQTFDSDGRYQIHIARSFHDSNEQEMLRTAEAVYTSPAKMVENINRSLFAWAEQPPEELAPLWGEPGNDRIKSTVVVTSRAVRYYYDLSLAARANPHLPTGFDAGSIRLKYDAGIQHFEQYARTGNIFKNVYVADLTLEWGFTCGGLCGMGFTRNKVVVLDANGKVIALYLDAPMNSEYWVS